MHESSTQLAAGLTPFVKAAQALFLTNVTDALVETFTRDYGPSRGGPSLRSHSPTV
jgi:hypothetical protein